MKKPLSLILFSILLSTYSYGACSDLSYTTCSDYPEYCEWNDQTNLCQDIGGTSGGETIDGPYQYETITESDGLRNGPDYTEGVVYYPTNGIPPYKSIVLTPGFGGGSSTMSSWAELYASHGFVAMRIGPNDSINDSHQQRGEGLIDAIETLKQENNRNNSPLYNKIDENSFSVSGYSMGGGASHNAAMMDSSIKTIISLNPTVIFENCELCPGENIEGVTYCICLVPELVNHSIPSLIFAGEIEINELPSYSGMLGQDIYDNMPDTTNKILFEGANSGHGFAAYPSGEVKEYALNWLKYNTLNDNNACGLLLQVPSTASRYELNIQCNASNMGDINGDGSLNIQDVILIINLILDEESSPQADINNDSEINILDIIALVTIILG